jgi:hypothetical protein
MPDNSSVYKSNLDGTEFRINEPQHIYRNGFLTRLTVLVLDMKWIFVSKPICLYGYMDHILLDQILTCKIAGLCIFNELDGEMF